MSKSIYLSLILSLLLLSCRSTHKNSIDLTPYIYSYLNTHSDSFVKEFESQNFTTSTITKDYINIHVREEKNFQNKYIKIFYIYATASRIKRGITDYKIINYQKYKINVFYNFLDSKEREFKISYPGTESDNILFGLNDHFPEWVVLKCIKNNRIKLIKKPNYYYINDDGVIGKSGNQRMEDIDLFECKYIN